MCVCYMYLFTDILFNSKHYTSSYQIYSGLQSILLRGIHALPHNLCCIISPVHSPIYRKFNWNYVFQVTSDYLQPQHETTINANGFTLRARSMEIRFRIDKARFDNSPGIIKIKCLAKIERFPAATREKTHKVFIMSDEYLSNLKLINSQNSGKWTSPNTHT